MWSNYQSHLVFIKNMAEKFNLCPWHEEPFHPDVDRGRVSLDGKEVPEPRDPAEPQPGDGFKRQPGPYVPID